MITVRNRWWPTRFRRQARWYATRTPDLAMRRVHGVGARHSGVIMPGVCRKALAGVRCPAVLGGPPGAGVWGGERAPGRYGRERARAWAQRCYGIGRHPP